MTPEQLLLDLVRVPLEWAAANSWLLWIVGPVLVLAFAVAYYRERDARSSGQKVAGGVAGVLVTAVAVVTGFAEGFAGAGGGVLDVLAPHADFLTHIGLTWAGWSAVSGGIMSNLTTFAVFALLLVAVSLVWGE